MILLIFHWWLHDRRRQTKRNDDNGCVATKRIIIVVEPNCEENDMFRTNSMRWAAGIVSALSLLLTSCSRDAETITLYEGLPHQGYESKTLEAEKKKPTIEFLKYPFYKTPLKMEKGDAAILSAILSDPNSFVKWSGEKKCGGFHPDYAIEWGNEPETSVTLICFGCGEVKTIHQNEESRFDISSKAEHSLASLLKKYRVKRPKGRKGP